MDGLRKYDIKQEGHTQAKTARSSSDVTPSL